MGLIGAEDPIVMLAVAEHRTFKVRGQQCLSLFDSIPLASSLTLDLNVCQRIRQGNYTRDSVALHLLGYFFLFSSFLFFKRSNCFLRASLRDFSKRRVRLCADVTFHGIEAKGKYRDDCEGEESVRQ